MEDIMSEVQALLKSLYCRYEDQVSEHDMTKAEFKEREEALAAIARAAGIGAYYPFTQPSQ